MRSASTLRHALRGLRRNPGFSALAIATLAFGIGANTAIFSIFDGVLLRPLGYGEESGLFAIHEVFPKFSHIAPRLPVNAMHFSAWRKSVPAFQQLALIGDVSLNLTGSGEPERLTAARVSPSLFPMLGARVQLGRTFLEEEDQTGRDNVVVLGNTLWRRRFASDPGIVGRKILLNGRPYEVVGVLSSGFHFPKLSQLYAMTLTAEAPELWKPFAVKPGELQPLGDFNYVCLARLRPGVSAQQALAQLNAAQARLGKEAPEKLELYAAMVPLRNQITGRSRTGLGLVLAAGGLVLLIGCVNIANLLLARATSRKRELAIRSALGAGAFRLFRQMLAENLLLAGAGGALGILLAYSVLGLLLAHAPVDLPRLDEVHLDARVLLFTVTTSILAGLAFGLLPAMRLAWTAPREALQSGARGSTEGRGSGRLRSLLVSLEVALSTVCLLTGGLLLRSFAKLLAADKGFAVEQVVTVNLNLPGNRYPEQEQRVQFVRRLLDAVRTLRGVTSVGVSNILPMTGAGGDNLLTVEGTSVPFMERPLADIRSVNPEYFRTLGIPLARGRIFEEADRDRKVALISERAARRLWPGENPQGRRFKIGDPDGPFVEVAGVVGDVRSTGLDRPPQMTVYVPYWQRRGWQGPALAVRAAIDPSAMALSIRGAIRAIDPELPVPQFRTMQQIVDDSVAQRRFQMTLILVFAVAALMLASLGVYGVVSYSVASRTSELGIRMALGAHASDILRMIVRQAMAPVVVGLSVGLGAALLAGRLLAGLLYGVTATDTLTIGIVVATLGAVAALASLIPARRATRIDPLVVMRYE